MCSFTIRLPAHQAFPLTVLVTPFYFGSEAKGRAAFRSLLEIGPYNDTTAALPYPE